MTITEFHNLGAQFYQVVFSEPITIPPESSDANEPQILMWSPSAPGWFALQWGIITGTSDTWTVSDDGGNSDDNLIMIAGQPTTCSAADAFSIASPQTTAT